MNLDDIRVPDTTTCHLAREVTAAHCSPALHNHCERSFLWAAALGSAQGIAYDPELLYVAALLHDLGLVRVFDSAEVPFEEAGGQVAWVFGAGAGWPASRRQRLAEIIVRHMWGEVPAELDPEGHLLAAATSLDISGRAAERWPASFRAAVVRRIPRLGLAEEFFACFQSQAQRKPAS
ncbi:MAG: HD domain-containing protein, partial [Candidatus Dormiibacterota bacterium]